MSRSVNLSPTRLRQIFKSETGLTPMRYLKHVRMRRAAKLLQESFLNIKEVAFESGAGDLSHFVRDFKAKYGFTPTEVRTRLTDRKTLRIKNVDSASKLSDSLRKQSRH